MRGEKEHKRSLQALNSGSPPHARGKVIIGVEHGGRVGITPACAGKSSSGSRTPRRCRDHPRMRGEKSNATRFFKKSMGSPPHARGKDRVPDVLERRAGITPACAGKSLW